MSFQFGPFLSLWFQIPDGDGRSNIWWMKRWGQTLKNHHLVFEPSRRGRGVCWLVAQRAGLSCTEERQTNGRKQTRGCQWTHRRAGIWTSRWVWGVQGAQETRQCPGVYLSLMRSLKETRPANLSRSLPAISVLEMTLHSTSMSVFREAFRNFTATRGWV